MNQAEPVIETQTAPQCIVCGRCLEVCPLVKTTAREELGPRAKGWLERYLRQSPDALDEADAARLAGYCLTCGRCKAVCPQGVDVPAIVAGFRRDHPTFRHQVWKQWLSRAESLWPLAGRLARVLPGLLVPSKLGPGLKALRGLADRTGPEPFVSVEAWPERWQGREVLLFPGCAGSHLAPRWSAKAEAVLKGLGMNRIEMGRQAGFGCCGSPLKAAGFADQAREARQRNLDLWRVAGRPMLAMFCASCLSGLAAYPMEEFESAAEAEAWAAALTPMSALLQDARFVVSENAPRAIGYHRPCHGRELGKGSDPDHDPDLNLLRAALGGKLEPLADACCGFGGVMHLTAPDLSDKVGAGRAEGMAGKDLVLTGCTACVSQLAALAPEGTTVGHWLDMLDISG